MAGARAACTWGSGGRPPVSRILGAPKRANARFSSKVEESAKNGHVRGAINLRFFLCTAKNDPTMLDRVRFTILLKIKRLKLALTYQLPYTDLKFGSMAKMWLGRLKLKQVKKKIQ
jgi:hypothetical protein